MDDTVKAWYDPTGDYLEVIFRTRPCFFRETAAEQIMVKVDAKSEVIGFSTLNVSALKGEPFQVSLTEDG